MKKSVFRLLMILTLVAGGIILIALSRGNGRLSEDIAQLEAELGRMPIDDPERIHSCRNRNARSPT